MNRYSTLKVNPEKMRAWQQRTRKPLQAKSSLKAKTGLKSHVTLKSRKAIKKMGKVGRENLKARKQIAEYCEKKQLKECEIKLSGCMRKWPLAPAHRHKRAWYKGNSDLLADPKQWVVACQHCHDQIEHNAVLTENIFLQLRGLEIG